MLNKLMIIFHISVLILIALLLYALLKTYKERKESKVVLPKYYTTIEDEDEPIVIISINNAEQKKPAMIPIETVSDNSIDDKVDIEKQETKTIEYELIETEGKIKQSEVDRLQREIDETIPEWLLESFMQNGWKVRITGKSISKDYFNNKYPSVLAMMQPSEKRIIIEKRGIHEGLAHEFGHYFDITFIYRCSQSEELKQIYEEEVDAFRNNIVNPGCVFNEGEFFAEAYYYSRVNPSKCTPRVLEYIERVSKQYEEGAHI